MTAFASLQVPGVCGIGVERSKTAANVGTLWRSAAILGASFIFTIGRRWPDQAGDTVKAWRHVPMFEFATLDALALPQGAELIGVEMDSDARSLADFAHPRQAVYLLGSEDRGLSSAALDRCSRIVSLPGAYSLNVAVAGSIVLYDRATKLVAP